MEVIAVLTDEDKLKTLANMIWYQESDAVQNLQFNSYTLQVQYLDTCKKNHGTIVKLLDSGLEMKSKYQNDTVRAPIADDIYLYITYAANSALQTVQNYTLRKSYLDKIKEHVESLMDDLDKLNTGDVSEVEKLKKEASDASDAMLKYLKQYRSTASADFSKWVKQSNMTFNQLVQRYQTELGITGVFEQLGNDLKLQVYNAIIKASKREDITEDLAKGLGDLGKAVLVFGAAIMTWDIFSSDHKIETAVSDAVGAAARIGGAELGTVVGTAIATNTLVGVEATSIFVTMAGIVGSFAGAFVLGMFAGWLVDLIFDSGGSAPFSTDGLLCFVAPMPDGVVLARQIQHH